MDKEYIEYMEKYESNIIKKYVENKEKYQTRTFEILETYQTDNVQSANNTQKVKVKDEHGNITTAFHKGPDSMSEYELLISRIGKSMGIPVAEVSLYLQNNKVEGISVNCNPDEEKYDFILGYDFVKYDKQITENVAQIQNYGKEKIPKLDKEGVKESIETFSKGLSLAGVENSQIENIKKSFLTMTLFNVIVDQKDWNYANFGILKNKEDNSYQMSPLFDNGKVKRIEEEQGMMTIGIGKAKKEDILEVLYSNYYEYIKEFSEKIVMHKDLLDKREPNMFIQVSQAIDDTILPYDAFNYKKTMLETIEQVCKKEKELKKSQNLNEKESKSSDVLSSAIKASEEITTIAEVEEQKDIINEIYKNREIDEQVYEKD